MKLRNAEVMAILEEENPNDNSVWGNCSLCGTEGELGTCFSNSEFILEVTIAHGFVWKGEPLDTSDHPYYMYGGYGSSFDCFLFFFTEEQYKRLQGVEKGGSKLICDTCMKRIFKSWGDELILSFCYWEEGKFTLEKASAFA